MLQHYTNVRTALKMTKRTRFTFRGAPCQEVEVYENQQLSDNTYLVIEGHAVYETIRSAIENKNNVTMTTIATNIETVELIQQVKICNCNSFYDGYRNILSGN